MLIAKTRVYDLDECIIASGYPMLTEYVERDIPTEKDWNRAYKLASTPANSGHANFLKGIRVSMDVLGSIKWWVEAGRYRDLNIVSSMSTMHMGTKMPLNKICGDIPPAYLKLLLEMQQNCLNGDLSLETFVKLLPTGLEYAARLSTNYLQLKTIYMQRQNHRLSEWKFFCNWITNLPCATKLILNTNNKEGETCQL